MIFRSRISALPMALLLLPLSAAARTGTPDGVVRETLGNGLQVVIVPNRLAAAVTCVLNYRVGSDEAPVGFPGMAHAQEHMMFRGSPGLSAGQLSDIAASMGGDFDADTQQSVTQYFFTVPSEDLDLALHLESIRMHGVLDTDKLWDQERGAIEQEVAQDLSNPEYVAYSKLLAATFEGTPYQHDALGTRPSFDKTTGAMLKKFYQRWYAPNNAVLIIVGNVQPGTALAEVKRLFGDLPAKKLPARPAFHFRPVTAETLNLTSDLPYGLTLLSFRMPGSDSPDFAAATVLGDVLSSQRGDLYGLVPAGKALFAGFSMDTLHKAGLGYALAAFPQGGSGAELLGQVRNVLAGDVKIGFSKDLVEAAKRDEVTDAELQKNSVSGLAMAWSQAVAVEGRNSPEDDVRAIRKVTVADVNRVARKYLNLDHAIAAVLTPQPSGKPLSSKSFGGRESFAPQQTKPVPLPAWAEKTLSRISVPASGVQPVVKTLPNGIRLIVQPESVSDTVSVYGHVKNNPYLETPAGKDGVADLLDRMFSYGSQSLDRLAYQKALDQIGAGESAGTDFSIEALSRYFDRSVQLLADNELHPAFPEQDFMTVRRQFADAVKGRLQSPDYLTQRALRRALFPAADPELRQATPESVAACTLPDVKSYYQRVFRPDLTTIVVIGKVTPEQAESAIEKYFGAWKATGPKPSTVLPPVPANRASITTVPDSSRVQDRVILAETLGLDRSNPDYYALELGDHVLGGGFYATRLYRDLRENSGLVYTVSSIFDLTKTRGLYIASYACDPPNVSKARALLVRDLEAMQTTPVTPQELRQAQAMLLREIPLAESSFASIAHGFISRTGLDLPLDEPERAAHHYVELNADQVKAAFAKWVHPAALAQVVEGPSPQ